MAETFAHFDMPVLDGHGRSYTAKACGRERDDGLWEGWIEFTDTLTGSPHRSPRETTQPNSTDLKYWATGLTPVYLEGALARALQAPRQGAEERDSEPPAFDGPSERTDVQRRTSGNAILNPFSVYEKSADLLAQELTALRGWHLRQIIKEYNLTRQPDEALDSLTERELGSLILNRVRELHA